MNEFNLLNHIRKVNDDSIVVWIFNIGTEKIWNSDSGKGVIDAQENIIVNHIEEINFLITRKQDYIILRKKPDMAFLSDLIDYDMEIPNMLFPSVQDETKCISELVLSDDKLINELTELSKKQKVFFVPYGVSYYEEEIAKKCGMQLIGGSHKKSCEVNNKIFSKKIAHELSIPTAEEIICESIDDIRNAYTLLKKNFNKVIIKMPCNSSGQGMWIVDNDKKLGVTCMVIRRLMQDKKSVKWLVEGWIDHKTDLNIQIYISETGYVEVFSIKEQIIDGTLYVGSVIPARITEEQYNKCIYYGQMLGEQLYKKGYSGIFGVDALIDNNDNIIPIIEINGRFTLSTYLSFIESTYPKKRIFAFFKRIKTTNITNYSSIKDAMSEKKLLFNNGEGIIIYNSATVDSSLASNHIRIFCLAIADNDENIAALVNEMDKLCDDL